MSVKHFAHAEVVSVPADAPVATAARLMAEKNVGSVIVKEDGRSIGILTDRDIVLRVVNSGLDPKATPVQQVMTRNPMTLSEDLGLFEALDRVKDQAIRRFPIVDAQGNLTGLFSLDDVIYLLGKEMAAAASIVEKEAPRL